VDRHASVSLSSGTPGRELLVDGKVCVALFGYPSWSEGGLSAEAKRTSNAAAALLAHRRYGRELLDHLHGEFGLIVLDRERGEALIAIDRMGVQPMSYSICGGSALVFGTTSTSVARHPGVSASISSQGIYYYLFFYRVPAPGTIFTGISKLLPAQLLHRNRDTVEAKFYWQIPFGARPEATRHDLANGLIESLRASVRHMVAGEQSNALGTFLSGGLDSSVITGLVNELGPRPVKAFTIGFDTEGYDEREYAAAAAQHFGVDHRIYTVTPGDVLDVVSRIASAYDEPFGNASAVPVYCCACFAKSEGVSLLIAGDGGDELFAGNASHLQMKKFELYDRLPAFLRHNLIEPIADRFPIGEWGTLGKKVKSYVDGARIAMPERMFGVDYDLAVRAASTIEPERLAEIDPEAPAKILREVYARPLRAAFEQRVHQLELQVVLADNDLRKVNRMCALAGINVRFPMLDEEVVTFAAKIPPELLLRGLRLRAFFKQAMAGFLPKVTLRKRKHGFGLPVGPWLAPGTRLQQFAYDCLSTLKGRHLLRKDFIASAQQRHRKDPHALNADPIWDLMMLELWIANHLALTSGSNIALAGGNE
jgi:asparagine synthase (glutamine-hydrolysing)